MPFAGVAAAGPGGTFYLFAGRGKGGQTPKGEPLTTVDAYNPVTNRWTTRASLPAPRHWLAATTGRRGLIYAIGGEGAGESHKVRRSRGASSHTVRVTG